MKNLTDQEPLGEKYVGESLPELPNTITLILASTARVLPMLLTDLDRVHIHAFLEPPLILGDLDIIPAHHALPARHHPRQLATDPTCTGWTNKSLVGEA
jgi:hypothetical protein